MIFLLNRKQVSRIVSSLITLVILLSTSNAFARKKQLPVPRFVTIKFNEVNARTGPVRDCPIEWVFVKKGEPVEVIAEYDEWRNIRDVHGEGGWVHSSVISGKRSVVVVAKNIIPLLNYPKKYDKILVKLKPQIRCALNYCKSDWCKIQCKSYKGWIAKKFLWGVYPDE